MHNNYDHINLPTAKLIVQIIFRTAKREANLGNISQFGGILILFSNTHTISTYPIFLREASEEEVVKMAS